MKPQKWKLLESEYLVNNRWLKLRKDKCALPNGNIINDFYVTEYPDWANVLAMTPDKEVVLVRQYRHGRKIILHELPGGIIENSQSALEAAQRELLEETGYQSSDWKSLGTVCANPDNHSNVSHCFLATNATRYNEQNLDENELIDVELLSWERVLDMAQIGEIQQSMHITTIFRALKYLE